MTLSKRWMSSPMESGVRYITSMWSYVHHRQTWHADENFGCLCVRIAPTAYCSITDVSPLYEVNEFQGLHIGLNM